MKHLILLLISICFFSHISAQSTTANCNCCTETHAQFDFWQGEWTVTNPDGSAIQSFKSGLAELLKAANLRETADGRLRDSGSFRPFYISQQIREGVNPHMLIRNTGTSGKMVNEHYNKILPTEEIAKLTPDWLKRRSNLIKKQDH